LELPRKQRDDKALSNPFGGRHVSAFCCGLWLCYVSFGNSKKKQGKTHPAMALHLKFLRGFRSFIYRQELSSDSAASHFRIPCSYFAFFFFFILKFDY